MSADYPHNNSPDDIPVRRKIKSYVLRQGRLTRAQKNALDKNWSDYGIEYCEKPLNFSQLFGNENDVVIEIGFGDGESLLQQAIKQPQLNFIGIEVHSPGVGHLIHNANETCLQNLKVIKHDAVEVLTHQVPDNTLIKLQLFFPDPWHKKRHNKRRIIRPEFITLAHQKLMAGGKFHMATDWQDYAQQMLEQMDNATGFTNKNGSGNYSPDKGDRCETKFERRGRRLGHDVWDLVYRKD